MAAKVLSIEIGNSVIRICQLDYKKKNPKVYRHVMVPTPDGAITDGYLNDIEAIGKTISQAIEENGMKKTKQVVFTAESSKILTREVIIPATKENLIGDIVKMNCNEYFPIELSGYEISHLILEKSNAGEDAGKYRVLVMAAEKVLVDDYKKLSEACDLTLIEMDYVGNSILQAFKNEDPMKHVMLLKIEETQTSISIMYEGNLLLQRSINYGIAEVIQEVQSQKAFGCSSYEDAWKLVKTKTCIRGSHSNATAVPNKTDEDEKDDSQAIFEAKIAVTSAAMPLVNAVMRLLDFYNSRSLNNAVEQVYVCGMGGDFSGLTKLIKSELGIKTNVLKKMKSVEWVANDDSNDTGLHNYAACFGATFAPVGFYSKEALDKEKHKTNYYGLSVLVALFVAVICATLWFLSYTELKEVQDENARLLALEEKYKASENTYLKLQDVIKTYTEVYAGSCLVQNPNDNLLTFFASLEEKLPQSVLVTDITSTNESCTISMQVEDEETAAGVVDMLRALDSVMDVSLTGISVVEDEEKVEEVAEVATTEETELAEEVAEEAPKSHVEFTVDCSYYPSEYEILVTTSEILTSLIEQQQ